MAALVSDIITSDVIAILRDDPPESFAPDDSSWLDEATLEAGTFVGPDTFTALATQLASGFRAVRAYHACRPEDPSAILDQGLRLPDAAWYREQALQTFHAPAELVLQAVDGPKLASRTGELFLGLCDHLFVRSCGHYLIYGSEALQVVAAHLRQLTGLDYLPELRSRGIPTIFTCDIPIEAVHTPDLHELAATSLSSHLESVITREPVARSIDFSLQFRRPIPPEWIARHRHPRIIPDVHDGCRPYLNERLSCGRCIRPPG